MVPQTLNEVLDRWFRQDPSHSGAQGCSLTQAVDCCMEFRECMDTAGENNLNLVDLDHGGTGMVCRQGTDHERLQLSQHCHEMIDFDTNSLNDAGCADKSLDQASHLGACQK